MSSEPSDWDPLPELGAAQYPGEAAALGPRAPASATAASAAPSTPAAPASTPAATLPVLRGSVEVGPVAKKVLPGAIDASSQLAAIMRTEVPARRPRIDKPAVAAPRQQGTLPIVRDAREAEPWFRALPAAEQARLQKAWQREAGVQEQAAVAAAAAAPVARQELLEWFWVAYVVFFLAALPLMLVEGLAGFVRMAMAGCVTGMVWQMVPRTRLWCVVSAVGTYLAIVVLPRIGELSQSGFDTMVSLGGACIVGYLASLAMHEELHRRPAAAPRG